MALSDDSAHQSGSPAPTTASTTVGAGSPATPPRRPRIAGVGRVLVVVYAILALGAFGRSLVQILEKFDEAPVAYTLSAVSAAVYIVATIALVARGAVWYRVAWVAISFEMVGVLVVGTLSIIEPELFAQPSVWSLYGIGYLFIPLVLPFLGMLWLSKNRPTSAAAVESAGDQRPRS